MKPNRLKNKLIIESGSTKTDWIILSSAGNTQYSTPGINPSADEKIYDLENEKSGILRYANTIEKIYYFGAGIIDDRTRSIVKDWLLKYFKETNDLQIESDMLGAAKATAGDKEGIICILGTGSNSCLYDGTKIIDNIPALGFALSNEGGGSKIGSELLKAYFYRKLPGHIEAEFDARFQVTKSAVVEALYSKENPTAYLAGFAKFLNETKDKQWRKSFLFPIFQEFIDIRIKQYSEYLSRDIYFVGSIAYFYADVIRDVLQYNGMTSPEILQKPIEGLVTYFK